MCDCPLCRTFPKTKYSIKCPCGQPSSLILFSGIPSTASTTKTPLPLSEPGECRGIILQTPWIVSKCIQVIGCTWPWSLVHTLGVYNRAWLSALVLLYFNRCRELDLNTQTWASSASLTGLEETRLQQQQQQQQHLISGAQVLLVGSQSLDCIRGVNTWSLKGEIYWLKPRYKVRQCTGCLGFLPSFQDPCSQLMQNLATCKAWHIFELQVLTAVSTTVCMHKCYGVGAARTIMEGWLKYCARSAIFLLTRKRLESICILTKQAKLSFSSGVSFVKWCTSCSRWGWSVYGAKLMSPVQRYSILWLYSLQVWSARNSVTLVFTWCCRPYTPH